MKNALSCSLHFPRKYVLIILLSAIAGINVVSAQVKGLVFVDYDGNGLRSESKPNEIPVKNVTVRVYVGNNNTPLVSQTDSAGKYEFTAAQVPAGSAVRVELSNFPLTFNPSILGKNSFTAVQFATAPATTINLGLLSDEDYCEPISIRNVSTACYVMGDPLKSGTAADEPAYVQFAYLASGLNGVDDTSMKKLAKASQIGATWGSTFQKDYRRHLLAALTRRHVGLGPLGTGGLYMIDRKNNMAVTNFLDVKTIGINTGPDPHIDPITNLNILPASKTARSRDSLAFHMAGKVGLASMQISRYQDSVFVVNLYDRKIYKFKVGIPLSPPANAQDAGVKSITVPHPNCSNGDFALWGIKTYRNKLYAGVVCTGETSQKVSDLKGAVYRMNTDGTNPVKVLEFPLDYLRDPLDGTQGCDTIVRWKPWSKTFPKQCNYPLGAPDPVSAFLVNPQPILSDIEFDDDGSMIIGMLDRGGLQTGQDQPGIAINDTLNYYGFMSGDILRAHANPDGTFTMESNGTSGKLVANGPSGPGVPSAHDKNAGPGGGEFFYDDYWINAQGGVGHSELTNGGLLMVPGSGEVFSSAMDPLHAKYLASGFIVFDAKTGKRNRSYAIYSILEGALGKSGGVGDLTGACEPAPLEIGNRIWLDKDRDGVQDPNEPGLDNIIVKLCDVTNGGTVVATDTSAGGGQYYFNDYSVTGGLIRNHQYQVKVELGQTLGGVPLADTMQVAPKATNSGIQSFLRDSDASYTPDSTALIINVLTGNNAENNHNLDIGLMVLPNPVDLELTKILVGDCKKEIGQQATFKIIVRNTTTDTLAVAEDVYVSDTLSANFGFVSAQATEGTYNAQTKLWGPLRLAAGESDTLTITVALNAANGFIGGNICNTAEVFSFKGGTDLDSSPRNGALNEDDYGRTCVSVPIKICEQRKDTIIISAPAGYATYQWFRDGVKIEGATSMSIEVGKAGEYTVEVNAQGCPTKNCCPIYIINDCTCPEDICVPFVMKKTKSKGQIIR